MAKKPKTQFNIRISESLMKRLTQAANKSGVTVTAETIRRLEESFSNQALSLVVSATAKTMMSEFVHNLPTILTNEWVQNLPENLPDIIKKAQEQKDNQNG